MSAVGRRRRRFLLEPERRTPEGVKPAEIDVDRARNARRRSRAVLHGCRDLIRAVEDLDAMDRLGLLPDAAERFSAAADDLRELAGKLRFALDDVTTDVREGAPTAGTPNSFSDAQDAHTLGIVMATEIARRNAQRITDSDPAPMKRHMVNNQVAFDPSVPKPGEHLRLGKSHSAGTSAELSDHRAGANPPAAADGSGPGGDG